MTRGLTQIVGDFADALKRADARRPQAASHRQGGRLYQPGIGPFAEDKAVGLALGEMRRAHPRAYADARKLRYPVGRRTCDLCVGAAPEWAIEIKLARVRRDNGTYEDAAVKKILSPYEDDRSAVTDCLKLAGSGFSGKKAILIYGFDDPARPLDWLIDAFELVAQRMIALGPRERADFAGLIHPMFGRGSVFAWELLC